MQDAPGIARARDLTGERYGALLVLERAGVVGDKALMWRCRCDCGRLHVARGDRLRLGRVRACGRGCRG